jgi:hypothetical protein
MVLCARERQQLEVVLVRRTDHVSMLICPLHRHYLRSWPLHCAPKLFYESVPQNNLSQVKLVRPDRRDSLGRCEGDRDHDVECRDGLFCYLRCHTFENVPGCAGGDRGPSQRKSRDFSIYKKETIFQIEILTEDLHSNYGGEL